MKDGFTRKKVESLTLGEKLKKLRGDFRMSLAEVSKATRIQVKYLEYLENGQYEKLPADVYVRGFLRSYARYLNIDEQAFIKLYEREQHIQTNLGRDVVTTAFSTKNLHISSFVITPRALTMVMIFLLVGGAFLYLYREFQSFAGVPRLVILTPRNGEMIETSEVRVAGKTDKGARVSINNQPVFVGSDGDFSDTLILQPGINTVTVLSINRFDKEKSETFSVDARYTPSVPDLKTDAMSLMERGEPFSLTVSTKEVPVSITLETDNTIVFSGLIKPGEVQTVSATERIRVTSANGKETLIRLNESETVPLGNEAAPVTDAVFTHIGRQE